jgi:hypothetical protein
VETISKKNKESIILSPFMAVENKTNGGHVLLMNIHTVISWQSVLMVEEIGVPGENHRPVAGNWQTSSHNVYRVHLAISRIQTPNFSGDISMKHKKKFVNMDIFRTIMSTYQSLYMAFYSRYTCNNDNVHNKWLHFIKSIFERTGLNYLWNQQQPVP